MSSLSYQALTSVAGFVELVDWSCIEVSGGDRAKFLHNMCTNDVLGLTPGQGCEAFFTDVKAHILAHVLVTCREESLVLTRSAPQVADLIGHLDRYVIREHVQMFNRTSDVRYLFVAGANVGDKLDDVAANPIHLDRSSAPLARTPVEIGGVSCALIRFPIAEPPAWLIECPRIAVAQVGDQLAAAGVTPCDREAWEAVRIENGFPLDRIDITEQNLPQEIARNQQAISFKKGCYLGQETVARIDALGHVNQTLIGVKFGGDVVPPRETPLVVDEKSVGKITSACYSPRYAAPLALAFVRRGHDSPGSRMQSEFGEVEVVALGR
ncbi:MAG: glycine cleavage T C-terminal barrel domain-containing protein [Pirellulales bacterium]